MRVYRKRGRALSLEGNYRSPQRNHWEEVVPVSRGAIDYLDAYVVEQAWCTLDLADRMLLRYHYCSHFHPQKIRRMVQRNSKVSVGRFDVELLLAQRAIALALDRTNDQNRNILRAMVRKLLDMVGVTV